MTNAYHRTDLRTVGYRLILIFFLTLVMAPLISGETGTMTFWLTADLEGYLVGCECPSGFSAGISAILPGLDDRIPEDEALIDLGGYREPLRSDPLLEKYLDEAAGLLGYSAMLANAADMRDGSRAYRTRRKSVPISVGGGIADSRFMRKLPGESESLIVDSSGGQIAIAGWSGESEQTLLEKSSEGKAKAQSLEEVLAVLAGNDADYRILAVRGDPGSWPTENLPDLVVFTGSSSPASELSTGGVSGQLHIGEEPISWLSIAPRGNGLARVFVDSTGREEISIRELERNISPEAPEILTLSEAFMDDLVATALKAAGRTEASKTEVDVLKVQYWYPFGCRDCDDFLWNTVPKLERDTGRSIEIQEWNTSDPGDFEHLLETLAERNIELAFVPVMIAGDTVLQGDENILQGLEQLATGSSNVDESVTAFSGIGKRWEPGAVFFAGLLDGVNPCAFSAMVFLVSALALAGRSKRTMVAIGLFYAAGIFITYSAIGAGLLGGLRRIAVESGIREVLEYILGGILLLLAVLSVIDGLRLSRGRNDLLLKLPERLSKRVHGIIRENIRSGAAAGSSFLLGCAVAVIELGCTGQVYLPTIAWMISRGDGTAPWLWLLLYNIAFIIPLMVIFVVSYKGVTAISLAGVFKRRGALVKYATAGLFTVLALVVLLV